MIQRLHSLLAMLIVYPSSLHVAALASWPNQKTLAIAKAAMRVRAYTVIALALIPLTRVQGFLDKPGLSASEFSKIILVFFGAIIVGRLFEFLKFIHLPAVNEYLLEKAATNLGCQELISKRSPQRLRNDSNAWASTLTDLQECLKSKYEIREQINTTNAAQLLSSFILIPLFLVITIYALEFGWLELDRPLSFLQIAIVSVVLSLGHGFTLGVLLAIPLAGWLRSSS